VSEQEQNKVIKPTAFDAPEAPGVIDGFRWRWQYTAAAMVGIFVISLLAFLVSARGLVITANTDQATIELDGGLSFGIGPDRFLLLKDEYQVDITSPGYHPLSTTVDITDATPPQLHFNLEPLPGDLRVTFAMGEPVMATVEINETQAGPAEEFLFENLEAGSYELIADAYLYAPNILDVDIRGRGLVDELEIELDPNWGFLDIETSPEDIEILAGDRTLNQDEELRVEAGEFELRITSEGYKEWTRLVQIEPGRRLNLGLIKLEAVDSQVELITSPTEASVTVNGEFRGVTPVVLDLLPEQPHEIQVFKAGYQSQRHVINVEREARETYQYNLVADLVPVNISISPANAQLYIDGELIGTGTQSVNLTAVRHRISVEAPGYATKSQQFLPVKGSRQLLQMHLMTEEQAVWANIPARYTTSIGQEMLLFRDAGAVSMGSSRRDPGRRANEAEWSARLERAFYVSSTETTNQQFRLFESEHSAGHFETISLDGANRPASGMNWQQAALFCNWLSEKEGLDPFYQTTEGFVSGVNQQATGYRLLTEVEWTWLAKMTPAGIPQKYIWGNDDSFEQPPENFADESIAQHINFVLEDVNDGFPVVAPVRSFAPNVKGIYDLGGNVMEWIHDWYQPVPHDTAEELVDPLGPDIGEFHVIRGASWARGYLPQLRLAYRDYDSTGRNDLGFRIARYAR
jgi:formylglycine-generating enzyme required for sulfatase activity